jgi:hypothetical protein
MLLLINSNLNHQIPPKGGQTQGGRWLAARTAYLYDPSAAMKVILTHKETDREKERENGQWLGQAFGL